ncbi:MAG: lamin tail domain-containing protein [Candidatus Zixiibacteriota bacterium]
MGRCLGYIIFVTGGIAALLSMYPATSCAQSVSGVIISEFLPDNCNGLESEWIELYNNSSSSVNIQGWYVGDELSFKSISDSALYIDAGVYLILAQDAEAFLAFYSFFTGTVIEPDGWAILNNSGDIVRLADEYGDITDSVAYNACFGDNRSWERSTSETGDSFWGPSYDESGSTPGEDNSFFPKFDSGIDITVSPDPFSPDGDGFEDFTTIIYAPPIGGSFQLLIYDIAGYQVRTLLESAQSLPGEIQWDGRDDSGRRLDIGIYILFARCADERVIETKKTIVIAR